MIVGITTVKNEADIIETSIRHLLAEGVDQIIVADAMSTDGTRDILADLPVIVEDDPEPFCYQDALMTRLAHQAWGLGATWIVPFDADEFWYSDLGPLAEVLGETKPEYGRLFARVYQHHTWHLREVEHRVLGKVAFRPSPGMYLAHGNHDVTGVPGESLWGVIDVRELQFRGFDHFKTKVRQRLATINPDWPWTAGTHYRIWGVMSDDELTSEWAAIQAIPTVFDPVPLR